MQKFGTFRNSKYDLTRPRPPSSASGSLNCCFFLYVHIDSQRTVDQLQQLILARNHELDLEQKRHKEILRQMNKVSWAWTWLDSACHFQSERECREQQFQVEEQKKGCAKMQELIEKLQSKIKVHKKQIEEAVSAKYKKSIIYLLHTGGSVGDEPAKVPSDSIATDRVRRACR